MKLTGPEARRLADALRDEIRIIRSMLQEAEDGKAWEACGHPGQPAEFALDLFDGDLCLPLVGGLGLGRPASASVSRPGARLEARPAGLGRTEVTPRWKGGKP